MPSIDCLTCGYRQTDKIPARLVGQSVKCPQCRRRVDVVADTSSEAIDFPMDDGPAISRTKAPIVQEKASKLTATTEFTKPESSNRRKGPLFAMITVLCLMSFVIGVFASPYVNPRVKIAQNVAMKPVAAKLPNNVRAAAPQLIAIDDTLDLVREYLKENTNSGTWEEIRWWPGFTMSTQLHRDALGETYNVNFFREGREGSFALESLDLIDICKKDPTLRFARMKYRTNNHFGHPSVTDHIFVVQDNEIRTLTTNQTLLVMLAWESLEAAEAGVIKPPDVPLEKRANDEFMEAIRQMAK